VTVLVTGGTGFVGTAIVHELRARGRHVRVLARRPERARRLEGWGAEVVAGDVTDPVSLTAAAAGCSDVVHLVALIAGRPADFAQVMTQGTRNVLHAAEQAGVRRFVLMSALGTGEGTNDAVPYFAAKRLMEEAVRASALEHVIFRPSFVFGAQGGLLPTLMRQVRWSPVVTVIGDGRQRAQPIWLDDVATYFALALDEPRAAARTFELGGPDVVTWDELYRLIARVLGKRRRLVHVPFRLARLGASVPQLIPRTPLTPDHVDMLAGPDNVVSTADAVETFGLPLVPLEEQLRRAA
jgi:NADH dehydrogenase